MALDVYVKEDILNVLRALHVSSEVPAALAVDLLQDRELIVSEEDRSAQEARAQERMVSYQRGFRTALASVALAFGLSPSSPPPGRSQPVPHGEGQLDLRSLVEDLVK